MKVFKFEGSYMLEVVIAPTEDTAWNFLARHDGTDLAHGDHVREAWSLKEVFDPQTMTEPACAGHYSG